VVLPSFTQEGIEGPEEEAKEEQGRKIKELWVLICAVLIRMKDEGGEAEETKEKEDARWPGRAAFR
jgi:hypothetical protein